MKSEQPEPHQTTRVWTKSHKRLKLAAALNEESLVELLDRLSIIALAEAEQKRGEREKQQQEGKDKKGET